MKNNSLPVLLLTGYLGSGKTTLLNRILSNKKGIRFAVIVNDIGEVNIDASLIQKGGIVGKKDDGDLVALQNGCICCTLKMDLVEQLRDLTATGKFDYIVIEASGICEPEPIAATIDSMASMGDEYTNGVTPRLDCIVTVVDSLRMKDEFESGDSLKRAGIGEEDIENVIIQQIEFCNIILLNKISEIDDESRKHLYAIIRAIQPKAEIIECDYADVDLSKLINTHKFNFGETATSAAWVQELEKHAQDDDHADVRDHDRDHDHDHDHDHDDDHGDDHGHHDHVHEHHHHHHDHDEGEAEEYGIQTFVYYRRDPFDINKLDRFVSAQWPRNVIRTKGVLYFEHQPEMSYLFEQAGSQKKLTQAGLWYATAPKEELEQFMAEEPGLEADWDDKYGDRMIKLVFIGQHLDRKRIEEELDSCLGKFKPE